MRRCLVAILPIVVLLCFSSAQTPAGESGAGDEIARIVGYSLTGGGAYSFLERLTDEVGGRVTGSQQSRAAADLILSTLKEAGFDNAHFEEYEFNPGWSKGLTTAEVVRPISRPLYVGTYGWVPGTPGPIEVPVVDIGSVDKGIPDIPASVHGAAVLVDLRSNALSTTYVPTRAQVTKRLAQLGTAAMLIISDKPNRMVYTSAFLFYPRGPLPVVSIAQDDAGLLRRLMAKGDVKIRLNVQNSFDNQPVRERNVIADLDGVDRSQMVLLTAHFDSWDAAEAANDNGVGVAAVLEAARILKFMNVRPQHRLRFVFFSGEEQDNLGSRAYAEQHKSELDNIWAIINTDHGAQAPPLGLHLFGRPDLKPATDKVLKPLATINANQTFMDAAFDSDEETFMVLGVPTFSIAVDDGDYNARHHTIIDTFDRVDPRLLSLQTAVLAVAGVGFADADQRPGKRLSPSEVHELLERTGLEPLYELEYPGEKPY